MAFLVDDYPATTSVMPAGEHGSFAVLRGLRHFDLLLEISYAMVGMVLRSARHRDLMRGAYNPDVRATVTLGDGITLPCLTT